VLRLFILLSRVFYLVVDYVIDSYIIYIELLTYSTTKSDKLLRATLFFAFKKNPFLALLS
jgi:hypothetical protein